MNCRHCGKELPDDAVFCQYCGNQIGPPEQQKSQPSENLPEHAGFTTVVKDTRSDQGVYSFALLASVIMFIGCFLPWIQVGVLFSSQGINSPDGAVVLIAALIGGSVALYNLLGKRNSFRSLLMLVAITVFITGIVALSEISSRAREIAKAWDIWDLDGVNFVGSGLYVIMVGALFMAVAGFRSYVLASPASSKVNGLGQQFHRAAGIVEDKVLLSLRKNWPLYLCGAVIIAVFAALLVYLSRR